MLGKDIISVDQFDKETLEKIFKVSFFIEQEISKKGNLNLLKGKILASLFFEPSTRTRFSFESAMEKLGGSVISATGVNYSSMAKGETLEDTIRTVERYADIIVIRHPETGSAKIAANSALVPVINAGDGIGEHPTQALLDYYTIKKEKKTTENLKIAFVGDLKHGRTIHSLIKVLSLYPNNFFYLVSPKKISLPKKYLNNCQNYIICENLNEIINDIDVLYMTRIQKERFKNEVAYKEHQNCYILDENTLKNAKNNMIIMHPLPRVNEITIKVDSDSRAKYFDQVENGLYVRAALMALVLKAEFTIF